MAVYTGAWSPNFFNAARRTEFEIRRSRASRLGEGKKLRNVKRSKEEKNNFIILSLNDFAKEKYIFSDFLTVIYVRTRLLPT